MKHFLISFQWACLVRGLIGEGGTMSIVRTLINMGGNKNFYWLFLKIHVWPDCLIYRDSCQARIVIQQAFNDPSIVFPQAFNSITIVILSYQNKILSILFWLYPNAGLVVQLTIDLFYLSRMYQMTIYFRKHFQWLSIQWIFY